MSAGIPERPGKRAIIIITTSLLKIDDLQEHKIMEEVRMSVWNTRSIIVHYIVRVYSRISIACSIF